MRNKLHGIFYTYSADKDVPNLFAICSSAGTATSGMTLDKLLVKELLWDIGCLNGNTDGVLIGGGMGASLLKITVLLQKERQIIIIIK